MPHNGLPHEAYGDLTIQTFQIEQSQSVVFVFNFSFLKPNQRFGADSRSHKAYKMSRTPYALLRFVVGWHLFNLIQVLSDSFMD